MNLTRFLRGADRSRSRRGFSALEMLVVLAILGIIILVTMPALLNFFKSMRVRTGAQRLVSHCRLARQVAVSRRSEVTLVIQGRDLPSTYRAWEDKIGDQTRDANGLDNTANNDDDEVWVVREDRQLRQDDIEIKGAYDDTSPGTYGDEFADETQKMQNGQLVLRFQPTGRVVLMTLDADDESVVTDYTLLRIRFDGRINNSTIDRWYVNLNSAGKVDTKRVRNPTWDT